MTAICDVQELFSPACLPVDSNFRATEGTKEQGAILLEALITILPALFIIIASIDLVIISVSYLGARYATELTARWAMLGQAQYTSASVGCTETVREASIRCHLREQARAFNITIDPARVDLCPETDLGCGVTTNSAGGPSEIFALRVRNQPLHSIFLIQVVPIQTTFTVFTRNQDRW